jgi:integrase
MSFTGKYYADRTAENRTGTPHKYKVKEWLGHKSIKTTEHYISSGTAQFK